MWLYFSLILLISTALAERVKDDRFIFKQNDYKMAFERMELVRYNDQYLNNFSLVTFKYNRTCPVVNMTLSFKIDIGEDAQIIIQGYRFASNEYRIFPMRFQVGFCESINKDMIGIGQFKKCGNAFGCPPKKGIVYHICNWAPDPTKYPPNMPNGQYMVEFQAMLFSTEIYLVRFYGTVTRPIHEK